MLLLTIVMQMGGLLLAYNMQQSIVRQHMIRLVQKKQKGFQKLTLTVSEFRKSRLKKDEICYDGKMYDVKSYSISDNVVDLLVVHDTKEEMVARKIARLVHSGKRQSHMLDNLVHLLTLVYTCPVSESAFFFRQLTESSFCRFYENTISVSAAVISPPPDLI